MNVNVNENWAEAPYDEELLVVVRDDEGGRLTPRAGWVWSDEDGASVCLQLEEGTLDVRVLDEDGNPTTDEALAGLVLLGWVRSADLTSFADLASFVAFLLP